MNYLLPILEVQTTAPIDGFGERILYGLQMLLIGMVIVFAVLALLWLSLEISGRLFKKLSEKEKPQAEKKAEPVAAPAAPATNDAELIAVLTAAVAAMQSAPDARFRVVSFRRK